MENLPQCAKEDLLAGPHVCRHSDGGNAVPADQFGEQTYIKRGKVSGGMKRISTSPEQVAVWVNSFSVCAHLDIAMEHMYDVSEEEQKSSEKMRTRRLGTRRKEKRGVWMIGGRSWRSWRSLFTPSMTRNQASIISATDKWQQTQ